MINIKLLKDKVRQEIITDNTGLFSKNTTEEKEIKEGISRILDNILSKERIFLSEEEKSNILSQVISEFVGFGPIESLLKDPAITEIMINGPKKIYVERLGKKELSNITFSSHDQLMALIYRILAYTRRRIDESHPYTDVSLNDGSRVHIIIPPLALDGPTLTIRKFTKEIKTTEELVRLGTLDKRMADFLVACIKAKINIIFSGATGAGKTTTLNVASRYIPENERIITLEDTAELSLVQDNVVRLEARQASIEGKGEVSIRELFKNSLRMRPNRIIVGEIRGNEVLEMLQAIFSGHGGSLVIIHAKSPQDVIYRLENMLLTSNLPMNLETAHRQIAAAVDLIVHQEQLSDGSRKITHITQVNGLKDERAALEDIFIYEIEGKDAKGNIKGRWKASGTIPYFYSTFKLAGIDLSKEIFTKD